MTRAALTLWEDCAVCGKAAGIPGARQEARCPACAARVALEDAAQADLEALAAPVLGAWAAHWKAAGVKLESLETLTEHLSGAYMHERAGKSYRLASLRRLARLYAPGPFVRREPARLAFDLEALPMLEDVRPPDARRGMPWPHFVDGEGQAVSVLPGPDAVTLTLPDGVRAVLYVGLSGQVEGRMSEGFRCPPHLWPAVAVALTGPYALAPTLEAVTVEGEDLALTVSLPGRPGRTVYRLPVKTPRSFETCGEDVRVTFRAPGFPLAVTVPAKTWATVRPTLEGGQA